MTFLFDTHALLWAILASRRLSPRASQIVGDHANDAVVSAASAWEIATKVRLGRLPQAAVLERDFEEVVTKLSGYRVIPITVEHALRAGRLPGAHGDPFDRMIAAQALAMDIPVLSVDAKLDAFGVRRIW